MAHFGTPHLIDTPHTRAREGLIRYIRTRPQDATPYLAPRGPHSGPLGDPEYAVLEPWDPPSSDPRSEPIPDPKIAHFGPFWTPFGPLYKEAQARFRGFWTILDQIGPGEVRPRPDLAILAN